MIRVVAVVLLRCCRLPRRSSRARTASARPRLDVSRRAAAVDAPQPTDVLDRPGHLPEQLRGRLHDHAGRRTTRRRASRRSRDARRDPDASSRGSPGEWDADRPVRQGGLLAVQRHGHRPAAAVGVQHGDRRRRARRTSATARAPAASRSCRTTARRARTRSRSRSRRYPTCSRRRTRATACCGECWVIAQEIAHIYGLDHEYPFVDDNSSACNDPMTYRSDCGGEKFFRNRPAICGEFGPARPGCGPSNTCASAQNSHAQAAQPVRPRHADHDAADGLDHRPPAGGTIANGGAVAVDASAQRGVAKVELWINGYKWARGQGRRVRPATASRTPAYTITAAAQRARRRDGHRRQGVRRHRRRERLADASTVTKGAPCADASTCAKGQKCDAGKCFWDAADRHARRRVHVSAVLHERHVRGHERHADLHAGVRRRLDRRLPDGLRLRRRRAATTASASRRTRGGCCSVGSSDSNAVYAHALPGARRRSASRPRRRRRR